MLPYIFSTTLQGISIVSNSSNSRSISRLANYVAGSSEFKTGDITKSGDTDGGGEIETGSIV